MRAVPTRSSTFERLWAERARSEAALGSPTNSSQLRMFDALVPSSPRKFPAESS